MGGTDINVSYYTKVVTYYTKQVVAYITEKLHSI
ncbi:hypothetical protein SAMN05216490_4461 [Mucilaginibacter mallensis]|uniref:Uncharacterized protein n=1 Tax=Mucilaginibacter mallensis TaxID=652787 RepID=A0A1H2BYD1_MUCMA|nr:hypothetical protein SAMN05216490_4461 [Mucilaginibacter mallensis]